MFFSVLVYSKIKSQFLVTEGSRWGGGGAAGEGEVGEAYSRIRMMRCEANMFSSWQNEQRTCFCAVNRQTGGEMCKQPHMLGIFLVMSMGR